MLEDDRSYFQRRTEIELERAHTATVPSAVQAHTQHAKTHLNKLAADEPVKVSEL